MAMKGWGPWAVVCWTTLLVLLQGAASQHSTCRHNCVNLQECPALAKLLRNPTSSNIKKLQDATCSFSGSIPKVCCPPKTTPKPSLLPRDCGQGGTDYRIHGGTVTPLGLYPWMAVLGYKEIGFNEVEYLCAGSIINERYILTAAHCVTSDLLSFKNLEVIGLGDWDLTTLDDCEFQLCAPPSQNFTYDEIIVHPEYNKRAVHSDDIALIRLSRKVNLSGTWIQPICLPPQGLSAPKVMHRKQGIVAGWGTTENGTTSDRLLDVELPLVNNSQCDITYGGNIVKEQICMGGVVGKDSCGGDSGGPMIVAGPDGPPYLQIGIVSYGPSNCGFQPIPGVYTDVSFYRSWIEDNIRP